MIYNKLFIVYFFYKLSLCKKTINNKLKNRLVIYIKKYNSNFKVINL